MNRSFASTALIDEFCADPNEKSALDLIKFFTEKRNPDEIAALATALARSGECLQHDGENTGDIASTGGPSSLSTLICPLYLASIGFVVPKLGVQGRPAGGIDIMAQIPGFDLNPCPETIQRIIKACRFAHFLAGDTYAPLDQTLFRFRQLHKAQAVPNLVIASILAKKIAVGVTYVGLEIRAFKGGNFGENANDAVENAKLFNEVAARLNIQSQCYITDGSVPYQPYIGRMEAALALKVFVSGTMPDWLRTHAEQCFKLATSLRRLMTNKKLSDFEYTSSARSTLEKHLEAHGTSISMLNSITCGVQGQHSHKIKAREKGYVRYNLSAIRDFVVTQQKKSSVGNFPDPIGIILLNPPGEKICDGESVISVRHSLKQQDINEESRFWFSITPEPQLPFQEILI